LRILLLTRTLTGEPLFLHPVLICDAIVAGIAWIANNQSLG
jgi:hypothetical protein